jgi:hypothetical protein
MVYIMQMEDRLIYLYEKYENIIMIEVYVMQMRKAVSFKFVEVVRTAIMEVVRTAIVEVVRTAILEVVRTPINKGDSNMFDDNTMEKRNDIKSLEMVETVINKKGCNKAEVHKELTIKVGDINMFEDIHMKKVDIVKFVEVGKKIFYKGEDNAAEMQEEQTVQEERSTGKREDYRSFRNMETRHCLILKGEGVSWKLELDVVFT